VRQAVILAGGKGTRLAARLEGRPKPLVDLGGVALLEHQIRLLRRYGFTEILILVSHRAERIVRFCEERDNWGLAIRCIDDGEPRGTAGAVLGVLERLAGDSLVVYGDTMLAVDLARFERFPRADPNAAATLFLHPNDHPHDSDLVELDDDARIRAFHPYPQEPSRDYPTLVNAALYWVRRDRLAPGREAPGPLDFARDLFPAMLEAGLVLRGYRSPEYIKDCGTPERLDRVAADLASGRIERASLAHPQRIVFLDRDGTVNAEVDHLREPDQLELLPGAGAAIRRLNRAEYRCCVVTNQPVVARGECSFDGLRAVHDRLETALGRDGGYLDRIYVCPHHPHGGFAGERPELKRDCDCRKPRTGLIERAAADFNLDRDASWLIGDTTVDLETARRAGLKSVLVETGYAGLDYRHWAEPDFVAGDLAAAVTLILEHYPRLLARCGTLAREIGAGALVLIGGQSRSGKSTLAAGLCEALARRGLRAWRLSADRWLHSAPDRGDGVLARYDLAALQAVADALQVPARRPAELALPGYDRGRREQVPGVAVAEPRADDVIVIEGTVALALETAQSAPVHRFYVETAEPGRRERLIRECAVRGHGRDEAEAIYAGRLADEVPVIAATAREAQRVTLDPILS